jgi:23S rRNA (guanosine2251-2'-O)-methyltransferase
MREWLFGRNPVFESLTVQRRQVFRLRIAKGTNEKGTVARIISTCRSRNIPIQFVQRDVLDKLGTGNQGVALEVSGYPYAHLPDILAYAEEKGEPPFILLLDALQDPQNLGTLLRSAEAFGVHGVCIPKARTALVTPTVISASSGAAEHLRIVQVNLASAIRSLKDAGIWVIGLDHGPDAQLPPRVRLDGAIALVVGNEGKGMRRLVRDSCDLLLQLPMQGQIESLNAAVAGSISLYLARQARDRLEK